MFKVSFPCAELRTMALKTYGGVDVYIHVFLTLALVGHSDQLRTLAALRMENEPLVLIG
jgi:hypothetical protein